MKTLYIIRGLPGSGKSTYAQAAAQAAPNSVHRETDMYFMDNEEYKFDASYLNKAHKWCRFSVECEMLNGTEKIFVSNTFTKISEITPYAQLTKDYGYAMIIIHMKHNFGSVHNVPYDTIERMKNRFVSNEDVVKYFENFVDIKHFEID